MNMRPLGNTGLQVSEIGFGALEIGRDWAADVNADPSHPSETEAARTLNGILDLGINFIDTAPAYWSSEDFIGNALAHRRSEYILATKVGEHCDRNGSLYDYSYNATLQFIDRSLARLKTDYIDLLQIHSAPMDCLNTGATYDAMAKAREAGKIRHIGMSGGVHECIRAVELGCYETVQVPYNLLAPAAEQRLMSLAAEKNVGVIIMRGLAGGKLTRKFENLKDEALREQVRSFMKFVNAQGGAEDLAHLAIQFVLSEKAVSTVILGSRSLERMKDNIRLAEQPISAEVIASARELARHVGAKTW